MGTKLAIIFGIAGTIFTSWQYIASVLEDFFINRNKNKVRSLAEEIMKQHDQVTKSKEAMDEALENYRKSKSDYDSGH